MCRPCEVHTAAACQLYQIVCPSRSALSGDKKLACQLDKATVNVGAMFAQQVEGRVSTEVCPRRPRAWPTPRLWGIAPPRPSPHQAAWARRWTPAWRTTQVPAPPRRRHRACTPDATPFPLCLLGQDARAPCAHSAGAHVRPPQLRPTSGSRPAGAERSCWSAGALIERGESLLRLYEEMDVPLERVLIRIPATWEGIQAAKALEAQGVATHLILVYRCGAPRARAAGSCCHGRRPAGRIRSDGRALAAGPAVLRPRGGAFRQGGAVLHGGLAICRMACGPGRRGARVMPRRAPRAASRRRSRRRRRA